MLRLNEHQLDAISRLKNGSILRGGVGSGKSRTAIAYYYFNVCDGDIPIAGSNRTYRFPEKPTNLYIITTAKKRNDLEWEQELINFLLPDENISVTVDSWQNIKKYIDIKDAFFIFDEQRLVGTGTWVRAFFKIAKANKWILLTATPADSWKDYMAVFVANGFYKHQTDFERQHCIFSAWTTYKNITGYTGISKLRRLKNEITVIMEDSKTAIKIEKDIIVKHDQETIDDLIKNRWNHFKNKPIQNASELAYLLRRAVNDNNNRIEKTLDIFNKHKKIIVFYNFNYELEALRKLCLDNNILFSEWNGQKHDLIPEGNQWMYLVQYTAGAEGWNCITTDTTVFFSLNHSYRIMKQSSGRIDRMDTPYETLYYYRIITDSTIDNMIKRSIRRKKRFNAATEFKHLTFA